MAEKHTHSIVFVRVESIHSAIEVWDSRKCNLKPQMRVMLLPMLECLTRNASGNRSSETGRPLVTSSLASPRRGLKSSLRPLAKKLIRSTCSKSTEQIRMVLLIASEMSSRIICSSSVSSKGKVGNESFPCTHNLVKEADKYGKKIAEVY